MVDTGQNLEVGQIASVGTAGADRHRRDADRAAEVRACERRAVPRQRGSAGRDDRRLGRAPQHVGLGRSARHRRRVAADRGAAPRARAAGDVHGAARERRRSTSARFRRRRARRVLRDDPGQPDVDAKTVSFDASFARDADGTTDGLTYYWDFGDGTHATGKTVSHTYSAAQWADVEARRGQGRRRLHLGRVPPGRRGQQPVGLGTGDARLRHVLRGRAQRADHRREGRRFNGGNAGMQREALGVRDRSMRRQRGSALRSSLARPRPWSRR